MRKIIATSSVTILLLGSLVAEATNMAEDFESYIDDQIIADPNCYSFVPFPGVGAGDNDACGQNNWEVGSGVLLADEADDGNVWGYSNTPNSWHDKYFYRGNTQQMARSPT